MGLLSISSMNSSPWHGQTFSELADSEKKRFYGYNVAVRYLDNASEGEVRDMFRLLTSTSARSSLRNCEMRPTLDRSPKAFARSG